MSGCVFLSLLAVVVSELHGLKDKIYIYIYKEKKGKGKKEKEKRKKKKIVI